MTADELRRHSRTYLTRCNAHDVAGIAAYLAPQIPDEYLAGVWRLGAAFPDFHWTPTDVVIEGGRIAARFIVSGTHAGAHDRIEATGRALTWWEYAFYEWSDGRIVNYAGDGENNRGLLQGAEASGSRP